jgi:hypothetical protein
MLFISIISSSCDLKINMKRDSFLSFATKLVENAKDGAGEVLNFPKSFQQTFSYFSMSTLIKKGETKISETPSKHKQKVNKHVK